MQNIIEILIAKYGEDFKGSSRDDNIIVINIKDKTIELEMKDLATMNVDELIKIIENELK